MRRSRSIYRNAIRIIAFFIFGVSLASCQSGNDTHTKQRNQNTSTLFRIDEYEGFKILTVDKPWKSASVPKTYILYTNGSTIPDSLSAYPQIQTPVKRVASITSAATSFMEELKVNDYLIAVDNADYLAQESLQKRCDNGDIAQIGSIENLNIERLLSLKPDVLFTYTSRENPILAQVESLGVPVVYISEYLESSPLQRAEWIKFIACFFDQENLAERTFASVCEKYVALSQSIKNTDSTTVLLSRDFGGNWYLSGGNSFAAQMIKDAGGKYLFDHIKEEGSVPISFETVLAKAADADIWLCNSLGWNSLQTIERENELYLSLAPYQNERVFNNDKRQNARGGNDYFASAIVHPERLLEDYINIFQNPDSASNLYYYRKLE